MSATPQATYTFQIEPMQLEQHRDNLGALQARFTNFWAGVQYPARLITRTRRFSFAPIRQRLRQQAAPLDDVRELIPLLLSGNQAGVKALLSGRLGTVQRALATLRDADPVADAVLALAQGRATADERAVALTGCQRVTWPWRWLKNYRRAYDVMEQVQPPLALDHYFVCWPEGYANPESIKAVLKAAFLLPGVEQAPLPSMFHGRYREEATHLAPLDPGHPYVRVLNAWDVRGDWDLLSLRDLLMQDMELAIALDVKTLSRFKAVRATTDAHTILEGAIYGKHAVKDAKSERAYQDVQYAMSRLDQQNLHEVAIAVLIQAPTVTALEIQTQTLRDTLGARMRLDVLAGGQAESLKFFTAQPSKAIQVPVIRRNALSEHVAVKTPWGYRKSKRLDGVMWGYELHQGVSIQYDLYGARGNQNAHLLMLGKSDSGKTVALGALALRHAVAGHQVLMLDPVGKAGRVIEAVGPHGGVVIPIDDQASINPLDVLSHDMKRQLGHVVRKLTMILGQVSANDGELHFTPRPITNLEVGALDRALQHATLYGDRGAWLASLTTATAPRLETLVAVLRGIQTDAARGLAAEIEARALDSFSGVYNVPTTMRWDFDHDVIAYDFQHANPELLPLIYDHGVRYGIR